MSNFAALIDVLTVAGSRLSDGSPNASGVVYFFQPGGNTPVNVYTDAEASAIATQPLTLTAGGLLNLSDFPDGIYVTQPVRMLVQDVDGNTVVDTVYIPATAGDVGVDNDGFTDSTLDGVLDKAFTSFGGQDWKYKESGGATSRTVKAKFAERGVSVKDFGAAGDGVTVDTTAIQSALNRAKALSCAVIIPAGNYKIDQALTLSSATGVSILAAGPNAARITTTHASANIFTFSSCQSFVVEGITLTATGTNSGSAMSLSSCSNVTLSNVVVSTVGGGTFLIPLLGTILSTALIFNCRFDCKAADATARCVKLNPGSSIVIYGGGYACGTGVAVEFASTTARVRICDVEFSSTAAAGTGILFGASVGDDFIVHGCPGLRSAATAFATSFDMTALSTMPRFRQWGNEVDGYVTLATTGGAGVTPNLARGSEISIIANAGGAGAITIFAPIPTPAATARGTRLTLKLGNAAGGAVTWGMSGAVYKLVGAAAPSGTDGTTTIVEFLRDVDGTIWREVCRSSTTT